MPPPTTVQRRKTRLCAQSVTCLTNTLLLTQKQGICSGLVYQTVKSAPQGHFPETRTMLAPAQTAPPAPEAASEESATKRGISPSLSPAHARRGHIHLEPHILTRAAWLPAPDHALLTAYYDAGLTIQRIADMLHLPPRTAARRLRILAERIRSPQFLTVAHAAHPDPELRALFGPPDPDLWPPTRRRVADAIYIRGLNMRAASRELRLSLHTVRRHNDAIRAILNAAHAQKGRAK